MSEERQDARDFEGIVREIAEGGIQNDPQQLKKDMCAQFSNPREWIREYATNASDAAARRFWVSACEDEDTLTVCVEDDGRGMDRKGVLDFLTVFRSIKQGDPRKAVGRHGIGKLSVAALEGQCGFLLHTNTGKESWQVKAGCLLDDAKITVSRVRTEPDHGTRFEITFNKQGDSRREELLKLLEILERYVKYLPIMIVVSVPETNSPNAPEYPQYVRGEWAAQAERFGRSWSFDLDGGKYEAILGIGDATQQVYQNRVLISDSYDLLSFDTDRKLVIPNLRIRVDSADFEVPFGRHRLMNEDVLRKLVYYLRKHVVPPYVAELCRLYDAHLFADYQVSQIEVEEIACALMEYDPSENHVWCNVPVFKLANPGDSPRLSLSQLRREVDKARVLYLENEADPGVDYSAFAAPVLASHQPAGALDLARRLFKKEMVNLSQKDVILVAPAGSTPELGPREKKLERCLRFHPEALQEARRRAVSTHSESSSSATAAFPTCDEIQRALGVCEEARQAEEDLAQVRWRVHYLVCRDGKTPCDTHRFLFRDDTVILNLYHTEINQLLALSEKAPQLAGHWGLAMCIADGRTILPHLSAEARADLIVLDAIAKAQRPAPQAIDDEESEELTDMDYREFLRNLDDPAF